MTLAARSSGRAGRTIAVFALLGPPLGALLLVVATIPLPRDASDTALTFAIAIALGYRVAFVPMLLSGLAVAILAYRPTPRWLRGAAAAGVSMAGTFLSTWILQPPEAGRTLSLPLLYAGAAGAAALLCLVIARPGRGRPDDGPARH
ncbi:hypothetical protein EKE94_08780 [Mesobaculum littorinae]|uniref:Uncharacterized protein n=1 Tax=Mesobaculum littorinae TaxID=2486419 RepID=A0A438AK34_9RHOB|nr:hypothetical protein [Mesobaculum littorinae]RVV98965.1 hypothetical protein EKE94_08780 [Mesobaculum littorinae]